LFQQSKNFNHLHFHQFFSALNVDYILPLGKQQNLFEEYYSINGFFSSNSNLHLKAIIKYHPYNDTKKFLSKD
jgi:hypothetical protein